MMKILTALLLLFTIAACSVPTQDEAGPPPAGYREIIENRIAATPAMAPMLVETVTISEPQPGRAQFIPGWRVCVRGGSHLYAFFFVKGQLQADAPPDPVCSGYAYSPWPELGTFLDQAHAPKWQYFLNHDELRQSDTRIASIASKNTYGLKFPYQGGTTATLVIKKKVIKIPSR